MNKNYSTKVKRENVAQSGESLTDQQVTDQDMTGINDPGVGQNKKTKAHIKYSRVKRRILKHFVFIRVLIITGVIVLSAMFIMALSAISRSLGIGNFLSTAQAFLVADTSQILTHEGNVNILLMGVGGEGHEGSELTDTMLVASVSTKGNGVAVISIPRDLWIPDLRAKINSAYYWGEEKSTGTGTTLARTTVETISGTQIQYEALIDFNGFKRVIDELGGITVNVERGFTDPLYPIAGRENDLCGGKDPLFKCRYEEITFVAGFQYMDGEKALKFVRSRHAEGDEGTDFARNARQQKVIEGIKNKVLTPGILLNPKKINSLWRVFNETIKTDMTLEQMAIIGRLSLKSKDSIKNYSIPEDLLVNPPISNLYDRLYVFIPKAGNGKWDEIHKWFVTVLPGN